MTYILQAQLSIETIRSCAAEARSLSQVWDKLTMASLSQRGAFGPSPTTRRMLKHAAWRLQMQISIKVPESLTAGMSGLGHDPKR